MSGTIIAVVALSTVVFGLLGFFTGKCHKPEQKIQLIITVVFFAFIAAIDVISGFRTGLTHIIWPWLIGVGLGWLRR